MSESRSRVSSEAVSAVRGRRRCGGALLALALVVFATLGPSAVGAAEASLTPGEDADPDDESDIAPFAVVVQHGSGDTAWYCGGSLVSLRTALTSAWCARGRELSVRAAGAANAPAPAPSPAARRDSVRRVARVAFASEYGAPALSEVDNLEAESEDAWDDAGLDLALLELEAPFGAAASMRPILLATEAAECGAARECHAAGVRARGARPLLRIVDLTPVHADRCAARATHWVAVRDKALCLTGTLLCPNDRGAGVVCDGKLCGVLSRSVGGGPGAGCGDTHVAQSVARWRRFLQCAHTLRACGRSGECEHSCMERRLLREEELDVRGGGGGGGGAGPQWAPPQHSASAPALAAPSLRRTRPQPDAPQDATPDADTGAVATWNAWTTLGTVTSSESRMSKGGPSATASPTRSPPPATTPLLTSPLLTSPALFPPPRMEFDPSRADFKAGEYGDNAADYAGVGEDMIGPSASTRAPSTRAPSTRARPPTRSPPPPASRAAPPSAAQRAAADASTPAALAAASRRTAATSAAGLRSHPLCYNFWILYIIGFIINIIF